MFRRIANLIQGFLGLFVSSIERRTPEALVEVEKENLRKQEQQQTLDQARNNPRNLSNPKCQFWLQQDQNAPNDKSRANVLQFCD